eukprot:GEMP01001746.1.p1 GENE.GEMP01001746.1~~GEMP01001746.1.p1  ORF type:complete len:1288 (+),score=365.72 GEMP01001746.1:72-3866(+)
MDILSDGQRQVWIPNHPEMGWAPGKVDRVEDGKLIVYDEAGTKFVLSEDDAHTVHTSGLQGVDDLLSLSDFNEGALLHSIRTRYFQENIYTGVGSPILISVNPYSACPHLYSANVHKQYRQLSQQRAAGINTVMPPHLFSVADSAFMAMLQSNANQSIIITGESGAGKTEATKKILQYLANIQGNTALQLHSDVNSIEQQVLRSNPVLESFGNAKTVRNDNSSRFGKFIEIEFDLQGKLQSAMISSYLLEKCRIVTQQPEERNYHSFYQLCCGLRLPEFSDLQEQLQVGDPEEYVYTMTSPTIDDIDDAQEFRQMVECLRSLEFSEDEIRKLLQITVGVLNLGNLKFVESDVDDGARVADEDKNLCKRIADIFEVPYEELVQTFRFKTMEDPFSKKIIRMARNVQSASYTRHSLAKVVYARLFEWLVWRINRATYGSGVGTRDHHKIGLLDIYGFEVFECNSFEQLCINFANEKLQQHFNSHMFTLEQQLYSSESINWSHIQWKDNQNIIDALERKPLGVFAQLDSECVMPQATDKTLQGKILQAAKSSPLNSEIVYKPCRFESNTFAVKHYAGVVEYDVISFLDKNMDKLHQDITNLLKSAKLDLLSELFKNPQFGGASDVGKKPAARSGPLAKRTMAKHNVTVSLAFRQQLDTLVADLNKTYPRYIRCIKPNANKRAKDFDSCDVLRQLRCAGMLESIRIRRAGYSVRRYFKEFFNHFRLLAPQLNARPDSDYKELCRRLLMYLDEKLRREGIEFEPLSWQLGRSKVFVREDVQHHYEKRLAQCSSHFCVLISKQWRGFVVRRQYRAQLVAARKVQNILRMAYQRKVYQRMLREHLGAIKVQKVVRALPDRRRFLRVKSAALCAQRRFRGWSTRQRVGKMKGKMAQERVRKFQEEQRMRELAEENQRELEKMQLERAALEETIAEQQQAVDAAREAERERAEAAREAERAALEEQLRAEKQSSDERAVRASQMADDSMREEKLRLEREREEWRRAMEFEEREREDRRRRKMKEDEEREQDESDERRRRMMEKEERERDTFRRALRDSEGDRETATTATASSSSSTAVAHACATHTADVLKPILEHMSANMGAMAQELSQLRAENSEIAQLRARCEASDQRCRDAEQKARDTAQLNKEMNELMRSMKTTKEKQVAEQAKKQQDAASSRGNSEQTHLRIIRLEAEVCKKNIRIEELERENAQLKKDRAILQQQQQKGGDGRTCLRELELLGGPVERLNMTMIPIISAKKERSVDATMLLPEHTM